MEPLTLEYVAKIIRFERPDAIVPGTGRADGPEPRDAAGRQEGHSAKSVRSRFWARAVRVDRTRRGPRAVQGAVRSAGRAGARVQHRACRSRKAVERRRTRSAIPSCCVPAYHAGRHGRRLRRQRGGSCARCCDTPCTSRPCTRCSSKRASRDIRRSSIEVMRDAQ